MHSATLHPTKSRKFEFKKIQVEKYKIAISPQSFKLSCLMKFCRVIHTTTLHPTKVENWNLKKIQDGCLPPFCQILNYSISTYV